MRGGVYTCCHAPSWCLMVWRRERGLASPTAVLVPCLGFSVRPTLWHPSVSWVGECGIRTRETEGSAGFSVRCLKPLDQLPVSWARLSPSVGIAPASRVARQPSPTLTLQRSIPSVSNHQNRNRLSTSVTNVVTSPRRPQGRLDGGMDFALRMRVKRRGMGV